MSRSSRGSVDDDGEPIELAESTRHRLLSVRRRRIAFAVLADWSPPVSLRDLAAEVAAREGDPAVADDDATERVAVTLHHAHLPQMAEAGVVDYDRGMRSVETCRLPPTDPTD